MINTLSRYVISFPVGHQLPATQLAAQVEGCKLGAKLQLALRQLVADRKLKLVGVALYEVV